MNKVVNLENAREFLKSEIKEISERYVSSEISIRALEKNLSEKSFTPEEEKTFEEVREVLSSDNKTRSKKEFLKFSEQEVETHKKVTEIKKQQQQLEKIREAMEEYVNFLEVATGLLQEVEEALK